MAQPRDLVARETARRGLEGVGIGGLMGSALGGLASLRADNALALEKEPVSLADMAEEVRRNRVFLAVVDNEAIGEDFRLMFEEPGKPDTGLRR